MQKIKLPSQQNSMSTSTSLAQMVCASDYQKASLMKSLQSVPAPKRPMQKTTLAALLEAQFSKEFQQTCQATTGQFLSMGATMELAAQTKVSWAQVKEAVEKMEALRVKEQQPQTPPLAAESMFLCTSLMFQPVLRHNLLAIVAVTA